MKNFFAALFLLIAVVAHADQWVQVTSMQVPRSHLSTFTIGNDAFTGCGLNYLTVKNDFWKYNTISDSWTQVADLPASERAKAFAFSINGTGYVGAGQTLTSYLSDFWAYDPALNSWSQKADFPDFRMNAVTFTIGDTGYVATGVALTYTRDLWGYNPSTNSWIRKADLPGPSRYRAFGFCIDGKGYLGTGADSTEQALDDFYEYDPVTDIWTPKSPYGSGVQIDGSSFVVNHKGYVTLGGVWPKTWEYSPSSDTWTQKTDFPLGMRFQPASFGIGNFGFICGGDTGTLPFGSVQGVGCWKYIPDTLNAINETEAANGFLFWPSPVHSSAKVTMKNLLAVTIFSEEGKLVFECKADGEEVEIDCSSLSAGKYFLKANSRSATVVHTFLKM